MNARNLTLAALVFTVAFQARNLPSPLSNSYTTLAAAERSR
ncbi:MULTISPECIES: hypothetical protein [unclassified Nocardia]|nr:MULTISPECIES: hypothetical protein [unclassified Nocardia]